MKAGFLIRHSAQVALGGYIDWGKMHKVGNAVRRKLLERPGTLFTLDCSRVHDFCGYALAEMVMLRRELQWQGSDLVLANCREELRLRLAVPLFESLALSGSM